MERISISGLTSADFCTLLDIVYKVNSTTSFPEGWQEALTYINQATRTDASALSVIESQSGALPDIIIHGHDLALPDDLPKRIFLEETFLPKAISRGVTVWRPCDLVSERTWHQSRVYREFLAPNGYRYAVCIGMGHGSSPTGVMCLLRGNSAQPYSENELRLLRLLQPHIENAVNKALLFKSVVDVRDALQAGIEQFDRPIFVFDKDLELVRMNISARQLCEQSSSFEAALSVIREAVVRLVDLKSSGKSVFDYPTGVKCVLDGKVYMIEGSKVCLSDASSLRWTIVAIDMTTHLTDAMRLSMAANELSQREAEICMMLVSGMSNREIAEKLFIAEFTVKDHVKSIFDKLGVSSRSEIAPKLLGLLV